MIRNTVTVLPPPKKSIKIAIIAANGEVQSDFNHVKRFITIKTDDQIYIRVILKDMKTMQTIEADGENLCLEAYLYEERTKEYTKKITRFKQNGGIVKPNKENMKIKLVVIDRAKVIDQCLIDIV